MIAVQISIHIMQKLNFKKINEIKKLRQLGHSISEISSIVNCGEGTAFTYAKNVKILPKYYPLWLEKCNSSKFLADQRLKCAAQKAKKLLKYVTIRDLILIGTMLYWAEGAKRDFTFSNTDPEMIKIFVYILRIVFKIKNEQFHISLRIYEDLNKKQCLQYWSKITGVALNSKTFVDVLRGSKKGKLKYGMCRIRVKKGCIILKEFSAIIKRLCFLLSPHSSMDRTRDS